MDTTRRRAIVKSGLHGTDRPIPSGRTVKKILSHLGPAIYAVRTHDGLVKIGWTGDLGNRLHSLGTTDLLGIIPGATRADEAELHRELAGLAVRGREWYDGADPAVLAVVNRMRTALGVSAVRA